MKVPYPLVNANSPFFYVTVTGIDLTTLTGTGITQLQVYRVQKSSVPINSVNFIPLEQNKNKFTFVFDDTLFGQEGGRFQADFYYLGNWVASTYFVYDKCEPELVGSTNV